jgi:4-hydroxybenzoate polyprenyltransferase
LTARSSKMHKVSTTTLDKLCRHRPNRTQLPKLLLFHLKTARLFTKSNTKTVILPPTVFGLAVAFSGPILTTNASPNALEILQNVPKTIFWCWISVLNFDISNQRLPSSIAEDAVNKPYRPITSKRITPESATNVLLYVIPTILLVSTYIGGLQGAVGIMIISHMYNELGGANNNWLVRNILNAGGFSCFSHGAASIIMGLRDYQVHDDIYTWIGLLAVAITTTVQMQDLPDLEGDKARNRGTMPIVYGHWPTRWSVAVLAVFWSVTCCYYWQLDILWYIPYVLVGACMSGRVLLLRTQEADEKTWKLWCYWLLFLYTLPLTKRISVSF